MLDVVVQAWLLLTLGLLGLLGLLIAVQKAVRVTRRQARRLGAATRQRTASALMLRDVQH